MTDVVLFHHAQGLTDGVRAFATRLEAHGHRVSLPDLYDGATYDTLQEGVAHAERVGLDDITARGVVAAEDMASATVFAGFSLGALPAQKLAQTRSGALGAVLYHGGVPADTFGVAWPAAVALQLHLAEDDEWSELDVVQDLARTAPAGELYVYSGSAHLITDSSLGEYDPEATDLILQRTNTFLQRLQ
jgi:dienelactone hydrolase